MILVSFAGAIAWIKALFGAGDQVATVAADAAADKRAATDLATSAGNVAEADRIAESAAPEEPTPPASPAARRPTP